jgi:2',3'-cyclic-nucleotide 2'-phosphodiesterase (5'-nucleotidase family)
MKGNFYHIFLLIVAIVFFSCNPVYRALKVEYKDYRITKIQPDSSFISFLKPYGDSLNSTMNVVIARLAVDLEKKRPEGPLGNFVADAMKTMAEKYYNTPVDAAFINYGGIRLPVLKAGLITRGKVYELMPFDNIVVIQKMKGDIVLQFLDLIAADGGWPAAGINMQIKEKKAVNVLINGKPIDVNAVYAIANSDYVANGGDEAAMLRNIPQMNNGLLFRDALIEYFSSFTKAGKEIDVSYQTRISNAQ